MCANTQMGANTVNTIVVIKLPWRTGASEAYTNLSVDGRLKVLQMEKMKTSHGEQRGQVTDVKT